MIEDEIRELLRARADDAQPSPDALERIEAKLDAPAATARRRAPLLAAAAVLAIGAIAGIAVLSQRGGDDTPVTSTPSTSAKPAPRTTPGVFPWMKDDVSATQRSEPVAMATAYVDARFGRTERTTVSDFQQGDPQSGEVVFGGDLATTVFVRRGQDGWYVVASASDLLTLHDRGDGSYRLRVERKGTLLQRVTTLDGESSQHDTEVDAGYELSIERSDQVESWTFMLPDSIDGSTGLAEVRVEPAPPPAAPPPEPPAVAAAMLTPTGTADPRDAAVAYLRDRLGGRDVRVDDFAATDETHGEVPWEAGVVLVQKLDDGWHVHEAIGDSIQIAGTSLDVGYIGGALTLAQAGTVHLTVGDVTWDVRNGVDREGTSVHFEHDVPTDEPVILRAVFDTATGFVSIAEKVVG